MAVTFGGVETAFVQRYAQDVQLDLQQMESRLRNIVSIKPDCSGLVEFMDKIGTVEAEKVASRFADSPIMPVKHSRRKVSSQGYDWGTAIEDWDMRRMNYDVIRPYATNAAMAMNRKMDSILVDAAFGTHYGSSDGDMTAATGHSWDDLISSSASKNKTETGFSPYTAGHKIIKDFTFAAPTGSGTATGLTPQKLLRARRRLQEQEVETYDQSGIPTLFIICSAAQIEAMLTLEEVQSSDYNDIHALVTGKVNYFAGFQFIRYEHLPVVSTTERVLALHPNALGLCVWADVVARIDELPNKRFLPYIYYKMDMGATRLDEKLMIEIECLNA